MVLLLCARALPFALPFALPLALAFEDMVMIPLARMTSPSTTMCWTDPTAVNDNRCAKKWMVATALE